MNTYLEIAEKIKNIITENNLYENKVVGENLYYSTETRVLCEFEPNFILELEELLIEFQNQHEYKKVYDTMFGEVIFWCGVNPKSDSIVVIFPFEYHH